MAALVRNDKTDHYEHMLHDKDHAPLDPLCMVGPANNTHSHSDLDPLSH